MFVYNLNTMKAHNEQRQIGLRIFLGVGICVWQVLIVSWGRGEVAVEPRSRGWLFLEVAGLAHGIELYIATRVLVVGRLKQLEELAV